MSHKITNFSYLRPKFVQMKITFRSPVTLTFTILATALYFLLETSGTIPRIFQLHGDFQVTNWQWYVSLMGYTLGHASITHLIGNFSIILLLGPLLEKRYGAQQLLLMMGITAASTALVHIIFWDEHLIGASGIVFMMIVLSSLIDIQGREIPFTSLLIIALFVGQEVIHSFQNDQISQFAHIFGGVLGLIFGFKFKKRGA